VNLDQEKVIVLASDGWHPGVIGIVASRLVERYHRPALLIAISDGLGKGSGRSIAALNLWEALRECSHLLVRFGGHHYAAGFAVAAHQVPELRKQINEVADARLTKADLVREIAVDAEAKVEELSAEAVRELNQLEPYGMGNPAPLLLTRELKVTEASRVGDGSHLLLRLKEASGRTIEAIWFGQGQREQLLPKGTMVDVCHRPRLDEWEGNVRVRLYVEDICINASG